MEWEGIIQDIRFRNELNGFTVMELKVDKELITAVGCIPFVREGERIKLQGEWGQHPDYGRQIKVTGYETVAPDTITGIEKYLASGMIRGIGPSTAKKIVEKFALDSLDIIQFYPDRLIEIDGIGHSKAEMIGESFTEQRDVRETMVFLQSYDISARYALKIHKIYGVDTINKLKENPYRLADDVVGIGFKMADRIAQSLGINPTSQYRMVAGTKYVLSHASTGGHTYYPREELIEKAMSLLSADREMVENSLSYLAIHKQVVLEQIESETAVYLSSFYRAEVGVGTRLVQLSLSEVGKPSIDLENELARSAGEFILADHQREAIRCALETGVVVITGGPGTGKTTIIKCILFLLEVCKLKYVLAAPTGRAAKRMTETTGYEAKTIHRLLEYGFGIEGEDAFQRNETNPIEADVVIIDEVSMVDILLMNHLLKALMEGTRLILVGDVDQLPSVGPGNVLRDIIESGIVRVVRLTEIFRQAQESMIVMNAHKINHGEYPQLHARDKDFFFERKETSEDVLKTIVELYDRRIPDYFGYDPMQHIQVLTPMKKGETGVYNLNRELQKVHNPPSKTKKEKAFGDTIFREGDKVMQVKNNYQLDWTRTLPDGLVDCGQGVFNGDGGVVKVIDLQEKVLTVFFDDDKQVDYDFSQLEELELSYAISIHKSQGSEFPVVLIPLTWGPPVLMTRNLLYTALTRAKSLAVIIGREKSIYSMVDNNFISRRYSGLTRRLRNLLQ